MTDLSSKGVLPGGVPDRRAGDRRRRRLGEILVESGLVDEATLHECIGVQATQSGSERQRIGEILVARGAITERDIAVSLARVLDLPMVDLANSLVSPSAARLLPRAVAERYLVLAIDVIDGQLTLAMSDPTDVVALDDVRVYTRVRSIKVVVATETAIRNHITRVWSLGEGAADVAAFDEQELPPVPEGEEDSTVDDAPVVRLVGEILSDAARALASDIHLEPERQGLRIRYRVDGLLRDVMMVPRSAMNALTSRVKIISGLDIAERRRPQDGRTRINVDGQSVDARVSTLPTMHGEKVVVRLLSRNEGVVPLARIGLTPEHMEIFLQTLVAPQGLILITGPTGSGKTSTLYSAVCQLRTPDRNLVTLEDPVEMALPGINQVQVHERAGVTFAAGLRSILRQDPDVILVGEVRDSETAELALRASLTGHLVFTTLHTNDAASALTRLVDMGVEPFLIASSLALVVAQRLVRVPCASCAAPYSPSPSTLDILGLVEEDLVGHDVRRGSGCDHCGHTGYLGRMAIFEVMPVDARMRSVLTATPTETAIRAVARASGSPSLRADGIAKALRGETTLEEVIRVTQVDAVAVTRCSGCRRVLDDGMTYCPYCAHAVNSLSCRTCAARLESEWRNCPWCRTATETAEVPVTEAAEIPVTEADVVVEEAAALLEAAAEAEAAVSGHAHSVVEAPLDKEALDSTDEEEFGTARLNGAGEAEEPAGEEPAVGDSEPAESDVLEAMEAELAGPSGADPDDATIEDRPLPRVVVCDDDKLMCVLVSAALANVAEVSTAQTAEEALRLCALEDVDAVVLDLHLPDLSGVELIRLLRGDARTNLLPLLLITGSKNAAMLEEARHAGVDDVMSKPIDPADLATRVDALLSKSLLGK